MHTLNLHEIMRRATNDQMPDGEGARRKQQKKTSKPFGTGSSKGEVGKPMIIKVQTPPGSDAGPLLVYNRNRDFMCTLLQADQPQEYGALSTVVKEKGPMGLKGYFTAELLSDDKLAIKVNEILAAQPW